MSVLFCDLIGFTAASERADPEDVQARIRPYHQLLRRQIEWHGGTVEKFIGDAVMAVFGAPTAHEDDPERAIHAALRILAAIDGLNHERPELDLKVRIGVNTGEVLATLDARPEEGEGIVAGDVVNTAARIQAAAPANGVAVSEATYRITKGAFVYEELSQAELKGKSAPLMLYRVVEPRARLGSDLISATSPLVGRTAELGRLTDSFDRCLRKAKVELVTLVGEPGAGKSRLCAELRSIANARPELVTWRQGRCLPYGDGVAFWALGELVKAHAGVYESDSPEAATEKLDSVLPEVEGLASLRTGLLRLLGIDSGQPASREESFAAWRRFFELIAAEGPTVLVVEDLHWADSGLRDFLRYLADSAAAVPLLVLCTARPELLEQEEGWGDIVKLAPLTGDATAQLLEALLTERLEDDVKAAILERVAGNPLYVEEFVQLMADRGPGGEMLAFPDSLQALIAARLDALDPEHKGLLQDAAVVGNVFWPGALAAMGCREAIESARALDELTRKEIVRAATTSSIEGEEEYAFWHILVRDVAYSQIPRAERGRRHRSAANWIEERAGERLEDAAEVLAHHYLAALELATAAREDEEAASLRESARRFLVLAGERALGLETAQAVARFGRALELCADDDPERPALLTRWADAAFDSGRLPEAASALEEALGSLRGGDNAEATAKALILASSIARRQGEARHVDLAAEAVAVLEHVDPGPTLVNAYARLATAELIAGDHLQALASTDRALELAERLGLPLPAQVLGSRGIIRAELGEAEGIEEAERALELLVEEGNDRGAVSVMNNLAIVRSALEGPLATEAAYARMSAFCEQRGLTESVALSEGNRLELLPDLGRAEEALELIGRLTKEVEESGDVSTLIVLRSVELGIRTARGETEEALGAVDELLDSARRNGSDDAILQALPLAAAALVAGGRAGEARDLLAEVALLQDSRDNINYAMRLPLMVRTALAVGDAELAGRLMDGFEPRYPLHAHALRTAQAALTEAGGDQPAAALMYDAAAESWRQFGHMAEEAEALLGQGRCLAAVRDPAAGAPLRRAAELFSSIGHEPGLARVETLLREAA